jgi:GH25 family lysozyme M1 (1,4-beta-N-acetylmuramidase)
MSQSQPGSRARVSARPLRFVTSLARPAVSWVLLVLALSVLSVAGPSHAAAPRMLTSAALHEAVPSGYAVSGIDIASYQHPNNATIDWSAVAATNQFVYIKATESTSYTNSYYANDLKGALAAGMYAGAYHFGRPDGPSAASQADYLLSVTSYNSGIGGRILPPFLDMETGSTVGVSVCYGLTPAQMSEWIHAFAAEFQARAGRLPVIYTSNGFWGACMGGDKTLGGLPLDVAKWSSTPTPLPASWSGSSYTFWQYADDESVAGITGLVDGDVFHGSMAQLAAFAAARPGTQTRTVVADADGDGKGDLITVNGDSVFVARSSATSFGLPTRWSTSLFFGNVTTIPVDVNGDGKADLVAINKASAWVEASSGSAFGVPQPWSVAALYGDVTTTAADVNGDGKADLIAVNKTSAWVELSTGTGFSGPQPWSTGAFFGTIATTSGDVNGDGKADLIAVNNANTWVELATASGFGPPQLWSNGAFYGNVATIATDVSGDGKADLVAVNAASVWVELASGQNFSAPVPWSVTTFYGLLGTVSADVTGDGKADLVAVNPTNVWTMVAGPSKYGDPQLWW